MALSNARLAKHPDRADVTLYNKDEAELLIQDFRGGTLANVTLYDVSTTKWWFISPEDFDTIVRRFGYVPAAEAADKYDEGRGDGIRKGYEQGYERGYKSGKAIGFSRAVSMANNAWEDDR